MKYRALFSLAILVLTPSWAKSEVADASANGFTVKIALRIQAPPEDVYRRLIQNVGDWWSSEHTYSGSSHNLSIEANRRDAFAKSSPTRVAFGIWRL